MKRIIVFWIVLLFASASACGSVWFVHSGGNNGNDGHAFSAALASFSAAVDSANNSSGADTLLLLAGDQLIGLSSGEEITGKTFIWPILSGDSLTHKPSSTPAKLINPGTTFADLIKANGSNAVVHIFNLNILANEGGTAGRMGCYAINGASLYIARCRIEEPSSWGVYANISSLLHASDCIVINSGGKGYLASANAEATITDSRAENCASYGFHSADHALLIARNCSAQNCQVGFISSSAGSIELENNETKSCDEGILFNNGDSATVVNSSCSGSRLAGLRRVTNDTTDIRLDGLLIHTLASGVTGLVCEGANDFEINHLTIHGGAGVTGVAAAGSFAAILRNIIITGCDVALDGTSGSLQFGPGLLYQNSADTTGANVTYLTEPLVRNPLWVHPSAGDYHLTPFSPARRAGTNGGHLGALPATTNSSEPWGRPPWGRDTH